jgi:hypothetical protein
LDEPCFQFLLVHEAVVEAFLLQQLGQKAPQTETV